MRLLLVALVLGTAAASGAVLRSPTTDGDLSFAAVAWIFFILCATVAAALLVVVVLSVARLLGNQRPLLGRLVLPALIGGIVIAFPVDSEWSSMGGSVSGLVPAAQALAMEVLAPSPWDQKKPAEPAVGYAYTCCS
jgi:hypothetical protein